MFTVARHGLGGADANPGCSPSSRRTGQRAGRWNFHKYPVARDGSTGRELRASQVDPLERAFVTQLEALLAARPGGRALVAGSEGIPRPRARQRWDVSCCGAFQPAGLQSPGGSPPSSSLFARGARNSSSFPGRLR